MLAHVSTVSGILWNRQFLLKIAIEIVDFPIDRLPEDKTH